MRIGSFAKAVAFVDAEDALAIDGTGEIEANIFAGEVFRAIAQLPEAQREAALLVYCEGYSFAEAASALGIPIGTVISRPRRGEVGVG